MCDPEVLSELRSIVLRSVYEKKLNELRLLREWLNPIAASIAGSFRKRESKRHYCRRQKSRYWHQCYGVLC